MKDAPPPKPRRDLTLERLVDSLLLTRAYHNRETGKLEAERVVSDALLLQRLMYPPGVTNLPPAAADQPTYNIGERAAVTEN